MTLWTDQNVALLREMAMQGKTGAAIADALQVSRNAVMGKVFRMGLGLGKRKPRPPTEGRTRRVWPQDAIAYLRQCCDEKKTSYEISEGLRAIHGVVASPNWVRSKAAKMGLRVGGGPGAHMAAGRLLGAAANRKKAQGVRVARVEAIAAIECVRVSFMDLTRRSCRFPLGHPGDDDFAYCGSDNGGTGSYCAGHRALFYRGG